MLGTTVFGTSVFGTAVFGTYRDLDAEDDLPAGLPMAPLGGSQPERSFRDQNVLEPPRVRQMGVDNLTGI